MSYIYTFIREDLTPAQKIVQIGHACYEAGKLFQDKEGISSLILLSAKDEEDLMFIAERLEMRGIDFYMFYEPDFGMGNSAICTRPITDKRERSFFKRWDLYKPAA
jgi:hypothetical protein